MKPTYVLCGQSVPRAILQIYPSPAVVSITHRQHVSYKLYLFFLPTKIENKTPRTNGELLSTSSIAKIPTHPGAKMQGSTYQNRDRSGPKNPKRDLQKWNVANTGPDEQSSPDSIGNNSVCRRSKRDNLSPVGWRTHKINTAKFYKVEFGKIDFFRSHYVPTMSTIKASAEIKSIAMRFIGDPAKTEDVYSKICVNDLNPRRCASDPDGEKKCTRFHIINKKKLMRVYVTKNGETKTLHLPLYHSIQKIAGKGHFCVDSEFGRAISPTATIADYHAFGLDRMHLIVVKGIPEIPECTMGDSCYCYLTITQQLIMMRLRDLIKDTTGLEKLKKGVFEHMISEKHLNLAKLCRFEFSGCTDKSAHHLMAFFHPSQAVKAMNIAVEAAKAKETKDESKWEPKGKEPVEEEVYDDYGDDDPTTPVEDLTPTLSSSSSSSVAHATSTPSE